MASDGDDESQSILRKQGLAGTRLVSSVWAPVIPIFAAVSMMALITTTHVMAVSAGHCDVLLNGKPWSVTFPGISPSTRMGAERWVWTLGVALTWVCFVCPTMLLVWEVLRWSARPPRGCLLNVPFVALVTFVLASFGLLGEALVPIQGDILIVPATSHTYSTSFHLGCADMFFLCAFAHGFLVVCWQANCCSQKRPMADISSRIAKSLVLVMLLLTITGPIPFLLLRVCPSDVCHLNNNVVKDLNFIGLAQRSVSFFIALFVASYSLDIRNMQMAAGLVMDGTAAKGGSKRTPPCSIRSGASLTPSKARAIGGASIAGGRSRDDDGAESAETSDADTPRHFSSRRYDVTDLPDFKV